MRQRKLKFLLVSLLGVSGLLFAGGEARAATVALNYLVNLDSFTPDVVNGGGTYTYTFTGTAGTGSPSIATIEFEIPAEINISTSTVQVTALTNLSTTTPTSLPIPTVSVFAQGQGDTVLKLGVEDMRYRVLKFSSTQYPFKFTLAFKILASAVPAGKKLVAASQVVLVASTAGVMDLGVVDAPSVVDVPLPVVIIDSLYPDNFVMTQSGMKPQTCAKLVWHSDGRPTTFAVAASSSGGTIGTIATVGTTSSVDVCPAAPPPGSGTAVQTTYTVTATGEGGTATDTATLTVLPLAEAAVTSLTLDKYSIFPSECPTLTWTTVNASHAFISNITKNGGLIEQAKVAGGSLTLEGEDCPLFNTTYTLTSIGWNGTIATTSVILEVKGDLRLPSSPPEGTPISFQGNSFRVIRDKNEKLIDVLVCGDLDYNASPAGLAGPCTGEGVNRCCSLHFEASKPDTDLKTCMSLSGTVECILENFSHSPHNLRYAGTGITDPYSTCIEGLEARFNWGTTSANCCFLAKVNNIPTGCNIEKRGEYTYCTSPCTKVHFGPGH